MRSSTSNNFSKSGLPLVLVTIALSLAVFMQVLDSTIANVAVPTIAGNLGVADSQGTWVITMFAVSNAISIPLSGWLGRRFGEVKVFLVATILFVICSWLCGISQSLTMLIVFRVAQGAVAGPMIPLAQSLLLKSYPAEKRALALGLLSMVVVTAPILGPIIGGYISDNFHWGWIFFINIPVGIIAIFLTFTQFKGVETTTEASKVDTWGLAFLVLGVGCLQIMLDRGNELNWFQSNSIIILAAISFVSLAYLIVWELSIANPIVNLKLFKDRNFFIGTLAISCAFMVYMGAIILLPMVLQQDFGYTALWAGLAASPIGFFPVVLTPLIGLYAQKIDMRLLVSCSFIVYCLTFIWRSNFTPDMSYWDVFWPQFIQGIGTAMFFLPLTTITLSQISDKDMASATGLTNFVRTLAGGIGTSLTVTFWDRGSSRQHAILNDNVTAFNPNISSWYDSFHSAGLSTSQANEGLNNLVTLQSSIISSNIIFFTGGVIFITLLLIVWFAKPPFTR